MAERPVVAFCYDHLQGQLAEALAQRLASLGWITLEPAPGITPLGWTGLAQWGIDPAPLASPHRKAIVLCHGPESAHTPPHIGGHLGFLLQRHLLASGYLRREADELELTPLGEAALQQFGVMLKERRD